MATKEMAKMLDELMGRNRNANPNDKVATAIPIAPLMNIVLVPIWE